MKKKSFQIGIFLFCLWRMYYNLVEVVPQWLNDSYFVVESFLVLVFIYSRNENNVFSLLGLFGSFASFFYFLMQLIDIYEFNQIGSKYFVPSLITVGLIIALAKKWQHYQ